jgi:MFS family permease
MVKNLKTFSSLKFPDFRNYYLGTVFSEVGTQMQVVAINWQIYELTDSAASLGLVGLSAFLAVIIFSLPSGLIVDKLNRKKVLLFSQFFPFLIALTLAYMSYFNTISPLAIYILVFLTFASQAFQGPARQSIIPQLIPKEYFVNAFSLQTISRQVSLMLGPAIAGFVIEFFGVQTVYVFNAASFIFYILLIIPIHIKPHEVVNEVSYSFKSLWEGVHFVLTNQILIYTMALDFIANFFSSATTLLPIFAKDIFDIGPKGLGLLYSAPAIGSTIAGLVIASIHKISNQGIWILAGVTLYGAATAAFGLSQSFIIALIFLCLVGVGDMISAIFRSTMRQILTPDHLKGRMIAVNMIFVQGGPMAGEAEAGFVAQFFGAPFSVVSGGVITVILTLLIAWKVPKLRKYQSPVII